MDDFPSGFYGTWPDCQRLLPLAIQSLEQNSDEEPGSVKLLIKVTRYFILTTQYPRAGSYVTKLYDVATRTLPEAHPQRLAAISLSVRYLLALEKAAEAERQIRPACDAARAAYGSGSIHTVQCQYWLSVALHKLGKLDEAIRLLQATVTLARQCLSPEHSLLLRIMHMLSRLLTLAGQDKAATEMLASVVIAQTRTLPAGEPALLDSKQEFALALALSGRGADATNLAKVALEDSKRYLGTEHVVSCMAAFTYANFSYDAVDKELPWACKTLERLLGSEHRHTVMVKKLGPDMLRRLKVDLTHPVIVKLQRDAALDTGIVLADALVTIGVVGDRDFSAGLQCTALEKMWISVAGWEHLRSLGTIAASRDSEIVDNIVRFARALAAVNRRAEAEQQYWNAVNTAREACGKQSHKTLRASVDLAEFLRASLFRNAHAEKLLRTALAIYRTHPERDDPGMYRCLSSLALCETRNHKFRLATSHLNEALNYYSAAFGALSEQAEFCRKGLLDVKAERAKYKQERKRREDPDYQTAGASSMEALALHAGAASGMSHAPVVSQADFARATVKDFGNSPRPVTTLSESLCSQCARITLASLLKSRLTQALSGGREQMIPVPGHVPLRFSYINPSYNSGSCRMCRLLLAPFSESQAPISFTLHAVSAIASTNFAAVVTKSDLASEKYHNRLLIYAPNEASLASKYVPLPRLQDPISESTLGTIRRWLQNCDECHSQCFAGLNQSRVDTEPLLPTRVIDVQLEGADPQLVVSNGLRGRYIALSHCWGGQTQFMCTRATLLGLCCGIPMRQLSKTARDAVYLARKLGIRYVWIDSLCIVQDDKQDWEAEAPRMGSIYESAYLTLAATAASNGNEGLFAPLHHENIVRLPCEPGNPSKGDMYLAPDGIAFSELAQGPLNRRGWVVQERLLSRRTLHFAATRVYLECQETYLTEEGLVPNSVIDASNRGRKLRRALRHFPLPKSVDEGSDDDISSNDEENEGKVLSTKGKLKEDPPPGRPFGKDFDMQLIWRDLITFYSSCGLTFPLDKLPALAGMVSKLRGRSDLGYHDGHWFGGTIDTLLGLLWAARGTQMTSPEKSRAASWSWASLEGPVEFLVDEVDAGRLSEHLSDLKIVQVVAVGSDDSKRPTLRCRGAFRAARRCRLGGHEPTTTVLSRGPYPRARFYHIGEACNEDYDWYPKPVAQDQNPKGQNLRFAWEVFAKRFPLRAKENLLKLPDSPFASSTESNGEKSNIFEPVVAPGVGWVAFDRAEEEPTDFELLYVCTRGFLGKRTVPTPQYLALACVPCPGPDGEQCYRRVGVAQVHKKDWFADISMRDFAFA